MCSIYWQDNEKKYSCQDTKVVFGVLFWGIVLGLQQTQLAGTCDRFGAPFDIEFAKNLPIVPFHSNQGDEKPLANLTIRKSLGNELEDF
jgi:hypothetical protein